MKSGKKLFDELELFIFDMDGLIFDTENIYVNKGREIAAKKGYIVTDEFVKKSTGLPEEPLRKCYMEEFGEKFPFDEHAKEIRAYIHELMETEGIPLKKGVEEILEFLKNNNKKIVLATSSSYEMATKLLKSKNILKYFDDLVTAENVKIGKPNPEVFLIGAEKVNANITNSMVFEDSFNGIKAAYAAEAYPVMIPDMLEPTEEIEKLLFKKYDSLLEVIKFFEKEK